MLLLKFSAHLSDSSLRQRSFASSGAVLDVAGGGDGEQSQEAQREQRVRHCCWNWCVCAWVRVCVCEFPQLESVPGCVTEAQFLSSLINASAMDPTMRLTRVFVWRHRRPVLFRTHTHGHTHTHQRPPVSGRSQQLWSCIRSVPSNDGTQDSSSVFRSEKNHIHKIQKALLPRDINSNMTSHKHLIGVQLITT